MSALEVWVDGVGLLGPGLASWPAARDVLRGDRAFVPAPTVVPAPVRLPAAERRRVGAAVKLALAVAEEAVADGAADPATLATVFASSSGEGVICHALCETLASANPMVSPTRFTNSVHNAASGCWHIAVGSRAASTSLCGFDGSFGAGLVEAATSVALGTAPLLLVASDSTYPEPLHAKRPLPDPFGVGLLLAPAPGPHSIAALRIQLGAPGAPGDRCDDPALDALCGAVPAAAALPLLVALARRRPCTVRLDWQPGTQVRVELA